MPITDLLERNAREYANDVAALVGVAEVAKLYAIGT